MKIRNGTKVKKRFYKWYVSLCSTIRKKNQYNYYFVIILSQYKRYS